MASASDPTRLYVCASRRRRLDARHAQGAELVRPVRQHGLGVACRWALSTIRGNRRGYFEVRTIEDLSGSAA